VNSKDCRLNTPVGTVEDRGSTGHWVHLSSICLYAYPSSMLVAQQMIHNLEPLLPLRIIGATNILAALELALGMVAKESEDGNNARRTNVERELILEYRELLDELGEALEKVRAVVMKFSGGFGVFSSRRVW
jgi:hypothetical protein